jgi:glucose 1-dehydrogenase
MKELFDLTGRKALVTGSSRGIGKAIALGLAKYGADIMVHSAGNKEMADGVAACVEKFGVRSYTCVADLLEADGPELLFRETVRRMGAIDILVLNASIQYKKDWRTISHQDFERQMNVNVRASLDLMQRFIPNMASQKWGRIVTIGSVQQVKPHPEMLVYAASKAAQLSIVKNLAKQLAPFNITVNNIAPGVIDTDRNQAALSDEVYLNKLLNNIPAGAIGRPEDCVGAILVLCSEAGRYITGENWTIDGGMSL